MNYRNVRNTTVRRNVTLNCFMADYLETAADFTGRSQSELLEAALSQPIMRRLYAFTNPCDGNPIVQLLETYQVEEGHMTLRIGETILHAVKEWVENYATMKHKQFMTNNVSYVNSYISGHITDGSMNADPYFKTVYDQASEDAFITADMTADELKAKVVTYINAVLNGPTDKNRLGEAYLFRNLLIILSNCFYSPSDEETAFLYRELSDGYVLPYHSVVS